MAKGRRGSEDDEDTVVESNFSDETEEEEEEETGEEADADADEDTDDADEDRGDDASGDADEEEEEEEIDADVLSELAGGRSTSVPIERFNEVLEQNRRLQSVVETAATRGTPAVAAKEDTTPKFDLKAKLTARSEAQLEGDVEKMTAIDMEIETYRIETATAAAIPKAEAKALETITRQQLDEIVEAAFRKYPFLSDADPAKHSPEALADVTMYRDRFISEGKSVPTALRMAVNKVCPIYAEEFGEDRGDGGKKPVKKGKVDPNVRTPEQIRRSAKIAKRIPERTGALGTSNRKQERDRSERGAHDMSLKEYRDIPDKQKRKDRGDFI